MSDNKTNEIWVNTASGEYLELAEGSVIKVVTEKQQDAINKAIQRKKRNDDVGMWNDFLGGFVFVIFNYCNNLMGDNPEIKKEDLVKLFYLATFVDYRGYLMNDGLYMKLKDIKRKLRLEHHQFKRFYTKMEELGILKCDKNKNVKISSTYFMKGEISEQIREYYDYSRLYISSIQYLYEHIDVRKHSQLGNYFKLIPYIHRQQNTLCWNPASKYEDMNLMHVSELKELIGYTAKGVKGFINELLSLRLESGEAILGFFRTEYDEGQSYIIVNPKVVYGGNFNVPSGSESLTIWFKRKNE
jgi:hypothetical protein